MAAEMEPLPATAAAPSPSRQESRVRCRSRRWVKELLGHCGPYVRKLGAGQSLQPERLERALGEALWNFETAVQENITINGQPWQESSDDLQNDTDIQLLEDQLDELIVEVASKRNQCPRKIQGHVIKTIKTQQNILDCCQPVVKPQVLKVEPSCGSRMADLRLSTETAARHIGESFKSLSSLMEKAEGFSKALSLQPTLELCKLHQVIFSDSEVKEESAIKIKNLMAQVEVTPPESTASNSVLLKTKRSLCSPQKHYPLQRKKIGLDT